MVTSVDSVFDSLDADVVGSAVQDANEESPDVADLISLNSSRGCNSFRAIGCTGSFTGVSRGSCTVKLGDGKMSVA